MSNSLEKQRFLSLIDFIKQSIQIKTVVIDDFNKYKDLVLTENLLLNLPGITFNQTMNDEEVWLKIERLQKSEPPRVNDKLLSLWIDFGSKFDKAPSLKSSVNLQQLKDIDFDFTGLADPDEKISLKEQHISLEDFTDKAVLEESLSDYVNNDWQNWLNAEKKIRKSMDIYTSLFSVSQQLQGNLSNVDLELVWGVGIATWQYDDKKSIRYPLLTQKVDIQLNQDTMAITVFPKQADVKLETEPFLDINNLNIKALAETTKNFFADSEFSFNPFNIDSFKPIIVSATSLLDSEGHYLPKSENPQRKIAKLQSNLIIDDTWVLIARPRTNGVILQDLDKFVALAEDTELTGAMSTILSDPANEHNDVVFPSYRGLYAVEGDEKSQKPNELYFPKAYNDEQVQIIQKLDVYDGVVVQGPPGTGKTHTIANVICHYLALGKRVLVTSMKDPALAVLRDKLPEDIRPLAVSLLTSETDGLKQFEFSISRIASEITTINRNVYQQEISQIEQDIDKIHASLALIDNEISHWAKLNLTEVNFEGKLLTPLQVAKEVIENQAMTTWLPDKLDIGEQFTPKFNESDIAQLRQARKQLSNRLKFIDSTFPEQCKLPNIEDVLVLHNDLIYLHQVKHDEEVGGIPHLKQTDEKSIQSLEQLVSNIDTLMQCNKQLNEKNYHWLEGFQSNLDNPTKAEIVHYYTEFKNEITSISTQRTAFIAKPITISDEFDNNHELVEAIENLIQGKKPFGLTGIFGKSREKALLNEVKILNSNPATPEEWKHILHYLQYRKKIKELLIRWNAIATELGLPTQNPAVESITDILDIGIVHDEIQKNKLLESIIRQQIAMVFEGDKISPQKNELEFTKQIANRYIKNYKLQKTWETQANLINYLKQFSSHINDEILRFIEQKLGDTTIGQEEIQEEWAKLLAELETLNALNNDFNTVKNVSKLIADSGASVWAKQLQQQPNKSVANENDALLPTYWQTAWRIKRLSSYVNAIDSRQSLKTLSEQRINLENELSQKYQQAISKRTWLNVAQNATPNVRQALEAYRSAIKKIGKGTGKRVPIYIKAAQEAAQLASQAIPCWIMPHYKISESLPAKFADFDLVIIDEASQSDLTALPALMRAKKVLVVGDDKQVAPDTVGFDIEKINSLIVRHLGNHVPLYRDQMSPERSIYDLFKVVFAESGVMLKEHFRCVAPIIEFSKREFYNHELNPLRKPLASEILNPPLVDVYVKDGVRVSNSKTNLPEARFIVDEIKAITQDYSYKGRSIGIVSLLGNEQAYKIMELISQELGEEIINEYQIACGDARTFQGKEKDIVFLSLVVSKGSAFAMGKEDFAQRMNVATSRARDRMYLVRSVMLEDLSQADIYRIKLLQHFQSPFLLDENSVLTEREKCESDFEREVFDILSEHGYRVSTQVKAGKFRIDMVVEGDNDATLAIECDGDRYHGPDKWEQDRTRQRILERAGWKFWRCFASTFVMNREQITQDLFNELTALSIYPIAHTNNNSQELVAYREVVAIAEENKDPVKSKMCDVSNGFKLCTCIGEITQDSSTWELKTLVSNIFETRIGVVMMLEGFEDYTLTQNKILTELNKVNCFDFNYTAEFGDYLKICLKVDNNQKQNYEFYFDGKKWGTELDPTFVLEEKYFKTIRKGYIRFKENIN
jgi:superfamily I DNA and/or RNA helicase/very-short-patch-repair endonuclease